MIFCKVLPTINSNFYLSNNSCSLCVNVCDMYECRKQNTILIPVKKGWKSEATDQNTINLNVPWRDVFFRHFFHDVMRHQAHSTLFLELETLACDPIIHIQRKKPFANVLKTWFNIVDNRY